MSGAPNFAYDRCLQTIPPGDCDGLDLSRWEIAIVGAEPIRAGTLDRFASHFAPCGFNRKSFFTSYGLAESTLVVTGGCRNSPPATIAIDRDTLEAGRAEPACAPEGAAARRLVSCGHSLLDQEIRIVDPATCKPCGPMHVGEIWVSGPSVAQGYWRRDAESREQFSATLPDDSGKTYLRTGDQGFLCDDELYVTGRIKDLIIVHGRNLYPEDIERVADDADPSLRHGRGAAFSAEMNGAEQLIVAHEVGFGGGWDGDAIIEQLRRAIGGIVGVAPCAVVLVKAGGIPRTSSGKIRRHACKRMFLSQELPCLHVWCDDSA